MHQCTISPEAAWELLKKYNKEPFHLRHGLTVAGALRWFAGELGYQGRLISGGRAACFTTSTTSCIPTSIAGRPRSS